MYDRTQALIQRIYQGGNKYGDLEDDTRPWEMPVVILQATLVKNITMPVDTGELYDEKQWLLTAKASSGVEDKNLYVKTTSIGQKLWNRAIHIFTFWSPDFVLRLWFGNSTVKVRQSGEKR